MSSPIDRSFDNDGVSPYAPKWARDLDNTIKQVSRLQTVSGDDVVSMVPSPDSERDVLRAPASLEPIRMPEPPMPEPWLRSGARSLTRGGRVIGAFFPLVLATALAALIAFVIVVELPKIRTFVENQGSARNSFTTRFEGGAPTPIPARPVAVEPKSAEATRSDTGPPSVDGRTARLDTAAAAAPANGLLPWPTQPVVTPPPVIPAPTISPPSAEPAAAAAPAADTAPSAPPPPVTSVKTVSIQPEKPARPLGHEEIETLLKQGKDFVSVGDFASARLVFRRVAEARDARGALALAATYDPIVLGRIGAKGATPDVAKAREWYLKAKDFGSADAAPRLEALATSTQ
jgi:hypothetical protein